MDPAHASSVYDVERLTADRARILLEINNAIVSHLDLAQVLKAVSACLRREIKHDFAAWALYDAERHELRSHALDFPADHNFIEKGQLIPLVGTPASLAFSTRKPRYRVPASLFVWRRDQGHGAPDRLRGTGKFIRSSVSGSR